MGSAAGTPLASGRSRAARTRRGRTTRASSTAAPTPRQAASRPGPPLVDGRGLNATFTIAASGVRMTKLVVTNGTHGILVMADDFAADNMDVSGNLGHGVVANFVNSLAVLTSQVNDNGLRGLDIVGMDGQLVSQRRVAGSGAAGIP